MTRCKQKLKCPNCNSRDIILIEEKIFQQITFTNKRTEWLRILEAFTLMGIS